jgi:hypothetical protein
MAERYYRIEQDMSRKRWFLEEPLDRNGREVDVWAFTSGDVVDVASPLQLQVDVAGPPLNSTLGPFEIPVVTEAIGTRLAAVAPDDLQRIPARIKGTPGGYEVLNILTTVPCLDEERSVLKWWGAADSQPEKVGTYRMVRPDMTLLADRIVRQRLFRVKGWEVALIASEDVKVALEEMDVTGVVFRLLTLR